MELKRYIFSLIVIILLFFFYKEGVLAAGGSISVSPETGNYSEGQIFTVSIGIDGGGQEFNAAKADLGISSILYTQDLTIGDCGFAFVKVPTKNDPSFAGVILGGSTKKCIVYTLQVKPLDSGTGSITLSNASIKSYKGASEILSSFRQGNYVVNQTSSGANLDVTSSEPGPTETPIQNSQGLKLYNIVYSTLLPKNVAATEALVTLDPQLPTVITASPAPKPGMPKAITVTFQNVTEGIHTIETSHKNKVLSSQVINVSGNNRNLEFGVSAKKQESPIWMWYIAAAALVMTIGAAGFFGYKFYRKRFAK